MDEQQVMGDALRARAATPSEPSPSVSGEAGIPIAFDATLDRVRKFAIEWKIAQCRGTYTTTVYELHPGDPRHAICDIDDIIAILNCAEFAHAQAMSTGTAKTPKAVEGRSPASAVGNADAPE